MALKWQPERQAIVDAAVRMSHAGLVVGTSGNISVRLDSLVDGSQLFAVTPAATPYESMTAADVAVVDFEIEPVEGDKPPSSESLLHAAIYQARADVNAVVHTHSEYGSVLAVTGFPLPPVTDEVTVAIGGQVEVSKYGFPGSQDLAENVTAALGMRAAALIRNHGAVAVGRTLDEAMEIAILVERAAKIFVYASLLGNARPLRDEVVQAEQAIYNMRHGFPPNAD
jgi:L-fuculose-phosphate aldolase